MRKVFKYEVARRGQEPTVLRLPGSATLSRVDVQDGRFMVWGGVPTGLPADTEFEVFVVGTGDPIPDDVFVLNTFFEGPLVWHACVRILAVPSHLHVGKTHSGVTHGC
ncbi:DUF7352 domain-containing protein [Pararobbsia silviterrae]|uniref:DUF7352 domain-containing protein n=1 Tax=Pararobbsia silviterrae TaxID=1792498 RepID=UPI00269B206C